MNGMINFNENFRKNVIYENIKSYQHQGFNFSLENRILEKPQIDSPPPPPHLPTPLSLLRVKAFHRVNSKQLYILRTFLEYLEFHNTSC